MTENEERLAAEFDSALVLRDQGDLVAARRTLELLVEKLQPADTRLLSHSHVQIGSICGRLGDHAAREVHLRRAVEVAPRLELASLGLFHALYKLRRLDEALREMVRFLRLRDSEMYRELLCPDYEAGLDIEQRELVLEARRLLRGYRRN